MTSRPFFAKATFVLVVLASLLLLSGSIMAQANPDYTIRLVCPTDISAANEGDSVEIQVHYDAAEGLGGFSLGFHQSSDQLEITSASAGSALSGLSGTFLQTINTANNTALCGFLNFNPTVPIPAGTDLHLLSLWVQVPPGVSPECVSVDSMFVPPAGPFVVTIQSNSQTVTPLYESCGGQEISVLGGCSANTPPNAICQDIQLSADVNCEATGSIDNGSNDPDGTITSMRQEPPGPYQLGTTPVTLWVFDDAGDSASCSSNVTVVDDTPPTLTCPGDITVGNDAGICGAIVNFAATVNDNCDPGPTVTYSQNPNTEFPVGTTKVDVTAQDVSGNQSTCSFNVTVNDTEAPVAICPGDMTVVAAPSATDAVVNFTIDATDNCSVASVTADHASGSSFPLGTTLVTVTAEDGAGNQNQCTFNVDVQAPPVVSDIPDQTIDQGQSFTQINLDDYVTDLDDADSLITWSATMFKSIGTITVDIVDRVATINVSPDFAGSAVFEFTATDPDGNSASDQATFTVNTPANEPPVVSDIPDQTVTAPATFTPINLDDYVTDPDDADSTIIWTSSGSSQLTVSIVDRVATITYPNGFIGSETITFTAADPQGAFDSDTATFTVNEAPNEPPVISGIPDQTINDGDSFTDITLDNYVTDPDNAASELTWTANELSNSAGVVVSISPSRVASITYASTGSATYEFVVQDPDGAMDADTVTFTINQVLNPDFAVAATPDSVFVPEGTATAFSFSVDVSSIDGFNGDVQLSATGFPSGVSGTFDTNPVTAPGSSTLEGTTLMDTPAGVYEIAISGSAVAKAIDPHSAVVYLVVEAQGCTDTPIPMVSQTQFDLTVTQGQNAGDEMVYVTNGATCGTLYWEAAATEAWVAPDPTSGSVDAGVTPGDLMTLHFNTSTLDPGDYTAQINVVSVMPGAGKSDEGAAIVINLTVEPMGESMDTVYVSSTSGYPGSHVSVDVNFKNDEDLAAMSLGLMWDSGDIFLDSVSYSGSRVDYIGSKVTTINNASQQLALGVLRIPPEALISAGSGLWARLWYTINPAASAHIVSIDSTFIPPGVELIFNDEAANAIYPQFVMGQIEILPPQDVCINGIVKDLSDAPIPGATVELYDDLGTLVNTTTSAGDGAYEFCVDGSMMGDMFTVRAHLAGYYPDARDATAPADDADLYLQPFTEMVQPTNEWVDLYCDGSAMGIDGPILPGDVIDAYDPSGVLCGRWMVTQPGTFGFMPVYRDDQFTPSIDEGCEPGDVITLKWNGNDVDLTGSPNPLIWSGNGDRYSACFQAHTEVTKCIHLQQGWNLISFNVELPTNDIESFFADIMGNVDVILSFESMAETYDPDLPDFSTLWTVDNAHGYWVRMNEADSICVTGNLVDDATPIDLELNWNLVSYLPIDPQAPADALSSILSSVIVVLGYDNGGLTYDPAHPELSDLTEMAPCFGYWIKTNSAGSLVYGGPPLFVGNGPDATNTAASYAPTVNESNTWIDLYGSNVTFNGQTLKAGSTISAYSEDGKLIGQSTLRQDGKYGFMPVYGPENFTADFAKVANAGKVHFKIDGQDVVQTVDWTANGDRIQLSQFSTEKGATLPTSFTLAQNYPNPFNPETRIDYVVAAPSNVRIEIYNMLGQKIRTLINDYRAAGDYTVTWHGTNDSGAQVASGVYLYKMTAGDYTETRKMTLLK